MLVVQHLDRRVDVFALRFERDDARLVLLQRRLRLGALINLVEVQDFLDLDQRKPDALAAQDQLQLARGRDANKPGSCRRGAA